ncbi:hypothetical protein BGX26_005643 [Mortierella sp. AD094]|nr:hypothetical protein BGX26_005643 [Mortierella sp. AD094]
MHITNIPTECILNVLLFLDLPDQHSLLLTCRNLFHKVVPNLYRSPFRAIIAFDGWQRTSASSFHASQINRNDNKIINSNDNTITYGSGIGYSRPDVGAGGKCKEGDHHLGNFSPSSVSSCSSSSSSTTSSSISSNCINSLDTNTAKYIPTDSTSVSATTPSQAYYTSDAQAQSQAYASSQQQHPQKHKQRPSSLQRRSYSDHTKVYSASSNGHTISLASAHPANSKHKGSISSSNISSNNNLNLPATPNTNTLTVSSLEQLKLRKMTRLLQLLIACTSIQARLPALRYPGYGQQWIRPPCKVDYLQYYIDQQQGGEIMIRCFHLLFADLVQCQWEDDSQASGLGDNGVRSMHVPVPIAVAPPDKEAYRVLYQIMREFMSHNAGRIRTLSVSTVHTIEHATDLVPQLANVTRLELTDLDLDQQLHGFRVDQAVDFVKSHRMLFGPILKDITLVGRSPSSSPLSYLSPYSAVLPFSPPSSPVTLETTFAALSAGLPSVNDNLNKNNDNNILTVLDNLKNLERIDATGWSNCILYLDRIIPVSKNTKNNAISNGKSIVSNPATPTKTTTTSSSSTTTTTTTLKTLWLSFSFPPSESVDSRPARLSDVLERCRNLEEARIPIRRSDVFSWAVNEKKTALICSPILANSKTKRLPKIRRLHLHGPSSELMDCVHDAAFAFQDTLEDLEARSILRVWQPATPIWEGSMVRLRRLKLEGEVCLHFSLESLKQCPAIEELSLTLPSVETWGFQQKQFSAASGHRQSHHQGKSQLSVVRHQNMMRIAELKKLRRLTLSGYWLIPDMVLRRIADKCCYLNELCLNQTVGTTVGGLLLGVENMSRLETLSLTLDIVDLHLVRVVTRKLAFLTSMQLTSLRQEE